jgi:hypothetical protein
VSREKIYSKSVFDLQACKVFTFIDTTLDIPYKILRGLRVNLFNIYQSDFPVEHLEIKVKLYIANIDLIRNHILDLGADEVAFDNFKNVNAYFEALLYELHVVRK